MKKILFFFGMIPGLFVTAQQANIKPITSRVSVQDEVTPASAIIDGEWVAVGTKATHAIGWDYTRLFNGKPSYRFELNADDNTLEGYSAGETKGRAELSFCYATDKDLKKLSQKQLSEAIITKNVYHYGKGSCAQASTRYYKFSVFIPSTMPANVNTIFAQWHGMPDRTLVQTPEGVVKKITNEEFAQLSEKMLFKKDTGYEKIAVTKNDGSPKLDAKGNPLFMAGKANGWIVEQGGYPPLAFGFSNGYFYIKANSDRKWLTDKTDRCNNEPEKAEVLVPRKSTYKACTIAYKQPFADFPKDQWVSFVIKVEWTAYGKEKENIIKPGKLDVEMSYQQAQKKVSTKIVDNASVLIGRNDDMGYYFKFGIYRVGNSTVPVSYNLADYKEGASAAEIK